MAIIIRPNLLRTQSLPNLRCYEGAGVKECWGQNVVTWTKNGDHYTKWPIPATERQLNTSLTQNDGWVD